MLNLTFEALSFPKGELYAKNIIVWKIIIFYVTQNNLTIKSHSQTYRLFLCKI